MKYKRLGDYIERLSIKNTDDSIDNLKGINIDKFFMPSVANVIGTDLSKYKIVQPNQFACNRMHVGRDKRLPIALSKFDSPIIVSPAYDVFKIIDTDLLDNEYLMMWFSREEFDRNCWFYTDTDVRGKLGWDSFSDMKLPIPNIAKQREIVKEYNTVTNRITLNEKLNEKLEETAQALYKHWFVDFEFPNEAGKPYKTSGGEMDYNEELDKEIPVGWSLEEIKNFGDVVTGKTPSSKTPEHFGTDYQFVTPTDFNQNTKFLLFTSRGLSFKGYQNLNKKELRENDVIITCIGSDMGKVSLSKDKAITNQQMNSIKVYQKELSDYLYSFFKDYKEELKSIAMGSSTMPMISKSEFELLKILKPSKKLLKEYHKNIVPINAKLKSIIIQSKKLKELQSLLLAKMTKVEMEKV